MNQPSFAEKMVSVYYGPDLYDDRGEPIIISDKMIGIKRVVIYLLMLVKDKILSILFSK